MSAMTKKRRRLGQKEVMEPLYLPLTESSEGEDISAEGSSEDEEDIMEDSGEDEEDIFMEDNDKEESDTEVNGEEYLYRFQRHSLLNTFQRSY